MSSAPSSINGVLAAYVAGRVKADRVVAAVAEAYYRETGKGKREGLRPVMDVIERSAPGMVELIGTPGRPGFEIRLGQREFPNAYETELKQAVEAVLRGMGTGERGRVAAARTTDHGQPKTSFVSRLVAAVRRLFSASA
jgi:hypothetical protein